VLLGLIAVVAGVHYVPPFVQTARVLWAQNRCAEFEYAENTVIFDTDRPPALLADAGKHTDLSDGQIWRPGGVGRNEPGCWTDLKVGLFGRNTFWPPGPASPKALVHRLRGANGRERLVAIILAPAVPPTRSPDAPTELGLVAAIVRPGNWSAGPRWDGNGPFLGCFGGAKRLKVFAARIDPKDAGRFTVPYEMDGESGTIAGHLDDYGSVPMRVVDGPARDVLDESR
jgi:hypothetical protein